MGGSVGLETLHSDSSQPQLLSGPEVLHWVGLMNRAAGLLIDSLTFLLTLPAAASYPKAGVGGAT